MMAVFVRLLTVYLCHSVTLFCMSKRKYSLRATVAAWSGAFLLSALFSLVPLTGMVTDEYSVVMFLASMLLYGVVYMMVTKGSFLKNLFIFATYASVFVFVVIFAQYVADFLWNGSDYAMSLVRTGFFVLYLVLLLKVIRPAFRRATANIHRGWGAMTLFAVVFCAGITLVAVFSIFNRENTVWRIAFVAALFLIMVTAYFVIYKMITSLNEESDKRRLQMQHRLLQSELSAEKEFVDSARHYRHDLRHHNRLILEYLNGGDVDGAREYLSGYDRALAADTLVSYCENTVVNAVLRMTARRCMASGTSFAAEVEIPEALPLSQSETGTLFSNLLENACEACDKCEDPALRIRAETRGNTLYVETDNTVAGETVFDNDLPQTTKQGGGVGMRSMKSVLDRHGGMLRCRQESDRFLVQIILPL